MSPSETARQAIRSHIWRLLFFGAVMSLAGNVVHAVMEHGWSMALIGPVVAAVIAPVALLGLMHLMGVWTQWDDGGGLTYWVFLAGVVALGAAAFRLSFAALRDLAMSYGYNRFDASLFPLILDGLMALMTWGLVAATRPKVAQQATADATSDAPASVVQTPVIHPVTAPEPEPVTAVVQPVTAPEPDPVTPVIQQPAARRDSHELPTVPPLMPSTHAPVIQHPEPATDPVNQPTPEAVQETANQVASWDDADTEPVVIQTAPAVNRAPEPVVNQAVESEPVVIQEPAVQSEPQPVIQAVAPANHPADTEAVHIPEPAVNHVDQPAVNQVASDEVDHRAKAETVAARRDWPVETLERISRNTPGPSNRKLAEELGASPATVQRMRKALAEETAPVA